MLTKIYEARCDNGCGNIEYLPGTKKEVLQHLRELGWRCTPDWIKCPRCAKPEDGCPMCDSMVHHLEFHRSVCSDCGYSWPSERR